MHLEARSTTIGDRRILPSMPHSREHAAMPNSVSGRPPAEPAKVVLVDDDLAVLRSLRFLLEAEGFDVDTFQSGAELLLQAKLPARGCFVIDYCMPVMNGLELLARLRDRKSDLPVILMTAHADGQIDEHAARAGVRRVFHKPNFHGGLVETIRHALMRPEDEA
jgi:two-component system response regulator FixJ